MTPQQIAHYIRQTRKDKGWSQAKLAELTGNTQPAIADIENFKKIPEYPNLKKIIETLGGRVKIEFEQQD